MLVVDDDPMVLTLLATVLQKHGFAVWTAAGGHAAVELYRQHHRRIAVALLDVRMPHLDGPQTLERLRTVNPHLACCFMSGHTGAYTTDDLLARGAARCFAKPFRLDEIAETLWGMAQA